MCVDIHLCLFNVYTCVVFSEVLMMLNVINKGNCKCKQSNAITLTVIRSSVVYR